MKRSSTITLLALVTLVVLCILSPWAGFSVMQAQEGWCCLNGEVSPAYSQARCEAQGGSFFATEKEAEKHCQAYVPTQGWCCLNGEVFPSSQAECEEMGGSFFATPEEAERHCKAYVPPQDPWWWLPPVIVTIAIVATVTIVFRHTIKMRRRKQWQEKAEEEEPPETCQPCTRHCRKIEVELKPALRKVTHLALTASPPVSNERSQKRELKNEVIDRLNKIVMARRRGQEVESLRRLVAPVAGVLLQQIGEWLHLEPTPRDVSIAAHLEGGKITCEFILYHCRRRGNVNVWEEQDKWKKTVVDKHDEPVGLLRSLDPTEPRVPEQLVAKLTRLLMEFIQKV